MTKRGLQSNEIQERDKMEEYSLRSQVFQTIRDDILKGKYEENDELREATLGKELGVSRTPVR